MDELQRRIQKANTLLMPYAVPHEGTLGRATKEQEDETRFAFQRDRDRIVHTQAFRRLKGKTQVFVVGGSDHHRTRLTHTMEVSLVGRDIARTLQLNEDLAECIALAHDLGHPPFGHAGEDALDQWMRAHGSFFEHNLQSHRVVTVLEEHTRQYPGLNLNQEVLDGLLKHRTPHDHPHAEHSHRHPTLEAQTVNLADEIAYTSHDCEDGLRAGLLKIDDITTTSLGARAMHHAQERGTSLRGALIHLLVMDLYAASKEKLETCSIKHLSDVYECTTPLICFSASMTSDLKELRDVLWNNLYLHTAIQEENHKAKDTVTTLCDTLHKHPTEKVLALQQKTSGALAEAVKDYVAGMTDRYAGTTYDPSA